jgi:hypothetical protein
MELGGGVIELGELRPVGDDDDLLPAPSERARRHWWRTATAAIAGLLCLTLTAAGPPAPTMTKGFAVPLVRAWFTYSADTLYMVSGPQEVDAYSLTDGHQLWHTVVAHQVSYVNLRAGEPIAVFEQGNCSTLSGLDPATGAASWTRTGVIMGDEPTDDTVRILHDAVAGCADGGQVDGASGGSPVDVATTPQVLDVVDPRTGVTRVSVPIAGGQAWAFGPRNETIAVWDRRGHMEERDLATGATVVTGDIPALAQSSGVLRNMTLSVWGFDSVWVVLDPPSLMADDVDAVVTAYSRSTLAPQWSVMLPAEPVDTHQFYGLWSCRPEIVCVQVGDTQEIDLDISTGRRLPVPADWDGRIPVGRHWAIVADPADTTGDPAAVLWDVRTDRNAFPSWHVERFSQISSGRLAMARSLGPMTEFAVFDADAGRMHSMGTAAGSYSGCEMTARQLLCVDDHLVVHVWPVAVQ